MRNLLNAWIFVACNFQFHYMTVFALSISQIEYQALKDFYYATNGDHWKEKVGGTEWNFTSPENDPCIDDWIGIQCNQSSSECRNSSCAIIELELGNSGLRGSISSSIGDLKYLNSFSITAARFEGTPLPTTIAYLSHLQYLSIQQSSLGGSLPSSLGQMVKLNSLRLNENDLTGRIPASFVGLSSLSILMLYLNNLKGSIPDFFSNMSELSQLLIHSNSLTGRLPESLTSLSKLIFLSFFGNSLSGAFPQSFGSNQQQLRYIIGHHSNISGLIPSGFGLLSSLEYLDLSYNRLSGELNASLFCFENLQQLNFKSNSISGSLPDMLRVSIALTSLQLGNNRFTGFLPDSFFLHPNLEILGVENNFFEGTLPSDIPGGRLSTLSLASNLLHGHIPSAIGCYTRLREFDISSNMFSGHLPVSLKDAGNLVTLSLTDNLFSGSIPSGIVGGVLQQLMLDDNMFTGSLDFMKEARGGGLSVLYVQNNYLTGTIPSELGTLAILSYMRMHDNLLTGTLPTAISKLEFLRILQLQSNRFSGRIENSFNNSNFLFLENIDLSDNALTGHIPVELFRIKPLKYLTLSKNCFDVTLSSSFCSSDSNIVGMALDGLKSGTDCSVELNYIPYMHAYYAALADSTIPDCFFEFKHLQALHLSGNGLIGQLVGKLPVDSVLRNLSLSHNRLTGSISVGLQSWSFENLDLSFNRLTGSLEHMSNLRLTSDCLCDGLPVHDNCTYVTRLILKENRLSGVLPSNFRFAEDVDVLIGNMFSCELLPENDPMYAFYSCGSSSLDSAMISWALVAPLVLLTALLWNLLVIYANYKRRNESTKGYFYGYYLFGKKQIEDVLRYIGIATPNKLIKMPHLSAFIKLLYELQGIVLRVTFFIVLIVGLLVLVLKSQVRLDGTHSVYEEQYSWLWSGAYLGGKTSAIVFCCVWCGSMVYFAYYFRLRSRGNVAREYECNFQSKVSSCTADRLAFLLNIFGIIIVNVTIVLIANGAYISLLLTEVTPIEKILIQFSLTFFNAVWIKMIVITTGHVFEASSREQTGLYQWTLLFCIIFNNILSPVMSSVFIDSACFRELFIHMESIEANYSAYMCSLFALGSTGRISCTGYSDFLFSYAFEPAYCYNYECSSSLISNYVPILLYSYLLQSILSPVFFAMISSLNYSSLPRVISNNVPGIIWPTETFQKGRKLIPAAELLAYMRSHVAVLMTFGMMSPPLAIAIAVSVYINLFRWQMYIGRYIFICFRRRHETFAYDREDDLLSPLLLRELSGDIAEFQSEPLRFSNASDTSCSSTVSTQEMSGSDCNAVQNLESKIESCYSNIDGVEFSEMETAVTNLSGDQISCIYLMIFVCCVFYIAVLVDMAGDQGGVKEAIWVVSVIGGFGVFLCVSIYRIKKGGLFL